VALGFVSQASGYTQEFLVLATVLLGFDLFIGLATLGRITAASGEEIRALQGMNRLRHAYLEMVPSLDAYFSTSPYDDLPNVVSVYGGTPDLSPSLIGNIAPGLTTTPGMIGTITAAVGGAFAAALALLLGASTTIGIVAGLATFLILTLIISILAYRQFLAVEQTLDIRFPPPVPGAREDR
jgi:hypothetical protein